MRALIARFGLARVLDDHFELRHGQDAGHAELADNEGRRPLETERLGLRVVACQDGVDRLGIGGEIAVEAIPLRYQYPSAATFMDARKETAGPLLTIIERLSPADRERVWAEIAATLQINMGTVKSRLSRGRLELRRKLEGSL